MAQPAPSGSEPPHPNCTITLKYIMLGKTPLNDWLARHRHLYLAIHNTHKRQLSMPQRDSNPQSQ